MRIDPGLLEGWVNLGTVYDYTNNLDQAMICYTKAKDLDPSNAVVWYNIGYVLKRQGSLSLRPDDIEVLLAKGIALLGMDEYDEASECFDRMIELDP